MAVLIADDLASGRKYHRALIRSHGSRPDSSFVEAATLDEAIQAVRDHEIEFVVLDLHFRNGPERGADTLKRFLAETRISPRKVYVCTADSDNSRLVEECLALGVAGVSNSGQPPWAEPPPTFTAGQADILNAMIKASEGRILDSTRSIIREEFAALQQEQVERDRIKRDQGIVTAMRVVAWAVAGALGTWALNALGPSLLKAVTLVVGGWSGGRPSGP